MATPIPSNHAALSIRQVLSSTRGRIVDNLSAEVVDSAILLQGVATDSRQDLKGKIFVALKGEHFDGHRFLPQAVAAGAQLLVVEESYLELADAQSTFFTQLPDKSTKRPFIVAVKDSLVALGDLALEHRRHWSGNLIAVAGSAGKTTTRSAIQALFSHLYPGKVHGTVGNLNNRIGVPMTLFGLRAEHQWAVVELGTNCPGEIPELARISEPEAGVLTLIDLEHTEGLGDLNGVELEEGALFSALPESALAVGYLEDERVLRQLLSCAAEKRGYLENDYLFSGTEAVKLKAEFRSILRIDARHLETPTLSRLSFSLDGEPLWRLQTHLLGKPGALAISAALSVALHYCPELLSPESVFEALKVVGEPGRSVPRALAANRWVIDDSYNSNPASVALSIDSGLKLAAHTGGRLWLVLGEMRELGDCSFDEHCRMGRLAAESGAEALYAISGDAIHARDSAKAAGLSAEFFGDVSGVASALIPRLEPSDIILVKASRGVRAEQVVKQLMNELPCREKS